MVRIGFLAHSTFTLKYYWKALRDRADCRWAVMLPESYEELRREGLHSLEFLDERVLPWAPYPVERVADILYWRLKGNRSKYVSQTLVDRVPADLWIADSFGRLDQVK